MTWSEVAATICNLSANVVLLRRAVTNPTGPISKEVVALQVVANACWVTHALWIRDPYLLTTASTSGMLQIGSLFLLVARTPIKEAVSDSRLPCLPPR